MINLEAITRVFVAHAVTVSINNVEKEIDAPAIEAVHNKNQPNRDDLLRRWFERYAVLQGFSGDDRRNVVQEVLKFADTHGCNLDNASYDALMTRYHALHRICGKAVRPTKKNGERDLISLTSKALWCCYPNAVPIYDRYAQNALWIISKFSEIEPRQNLTGNKYGAFADVWLTIYKKAEGVISQADLRGYPYKLRVFDRMLWIIGRPAYSGRLGLE